MSLEAVIEILKAIFSGKKGPFEAVHDNPALIVIPFIMALLSVATYLIKMKDGPRWGAAIVTASLAGVLTLPLFLMQPPPPLPPQPTAGGSQTDKRPALVRFEVTRDATLGSARQFATSRTLTTVVACEQECASESRCLAYVYDIIAKSCSMRLEAGQPTKMKDSVTGIKQTR